MARIGRWFLALSMVVMLAGLVPQAGAQIIIRTGHGRRYHHHRHYHHRYHRY